MWTVRVRGDEPWPIVLNVVFLDLLDVVVTLREVHAFRILPGKVSDQAERGEYYYHGPEAGVGEEALDDADVFVGDVYHGGDGGVDGHEDEPEEEGAGDGDEGVFGPDVGDEGGFEQDGGEIGGVGGGAPYPMASVATVPLWPVIENEGL